jgi:GT2 family glycosyltransferase
MAHFAPAKLSLEPQVAFQSNQYDSAILRPGTSSIMLSIIIVNWNTRRDLLRCLASIGTNPPTCPFEVLVFDNASTDGSAEAVLSEFPQVCLEVSPENVGFARANNRKASSAEGRFLLLLNPDTVVHPGAIDALISYVARHPQAAAVGPRLHNSDGSLQPSVERLPSLFREWWRLFHLDRLYPVSQYPKAVLASRAPQRVEVLNGACLLLRADAARPLGFFDEEYFVYSEEVDLCDRLRQAGWELHWLPEAIVTHSGGQSTRQVADAMFLELYRNKIKFFRKRRSDLAGTMYKIILLQACLSRFGLAVAARAISLPRQDWVDVARQYRLLVAELLTL